MRPHTTNRPRRKYKFPGLAALLLFVLAGPVCAQEAVWHLVFQPTFMRPDFMIPIAGTKETILTPALIRGEDATVLKKKDADRLKLDMDSIRRIARASASAELAKLKPEYVRDKHGVAIFALLASDSPATASAVLAPDFAEKFADTLGPDLLVAIPNRYRIYVYPALASRFQETASLVLRDYEISGYPVSKEVFRLTPQGLVAIGAFEAQ
jgi:hypothetical protein